MKKLMMIAALAGFASAPASAYYIGSLGYPMKDGANSLEAIYDTGSREMEPSGGGETGDVDTNRLYVQWGHGLGNGLELFGRVMPQTGEASLEDSDLDFEMWGLGGGVRWSPRQKGKVKFGLQASFDWSQGDEKNISSISMDIKEMMFSGGVSSRVNKNVDVYGGLSLLKSDATLDYPGDSVDMKNSNTFGIFGGLDLKPSKNFTVGVELHLINETVFAFSGRLKF
jgi:opacity protein-like surface antigen